MPTPPEPRPLPLSPAPPTLGELFRGFLGVGLMGFGGVLPWTRRMVVEQRGWLSGPEFTDLLALCQFLPGPNVANLSVALGTRFHGVPGALASLAGLLTAPVAVVLALGSLYARFGQHPEVRGAFEGLAAAASGLLVAMACRIAWPLRSSPAAVLIVALAFVAIALLRLPLLPTLLALAALGVLVMPRRPG